MTEVAEVEVEAESGRAALGRALKFLREQAGLSLGRLAEATYDGVGMAFNGDAAAWGERADHHTVFVHVDKYGDLSRAERLAASIGSTVLGAAQRGW
ncbi:hypothetical protein GT040_21780 [Streptomyces sp. SID2119]|nr:hypothetical protein [Streptomyces sp. SID2119]